VEIRAARAGMVDNSTSGVAGVEWREGGVVCSGQLRSTGALRRGVGVSVYGRRACAHSPWRYTSRLHGTPNNEVLRLQV